MIRQGMWQATMRDAEGNVLLIIIHLDDPGFVRRVLSHVLLGVAWKYMEQRATPGVSFEKGATNDQAHT